MQGQMGGAAIGLLANQAAARGQALLDAGRPGEAATLLTAASQRHPGDAGILTLNGVALLAAGDVRSAVGALFLAMELRPGDAGAHGRLAGALHQAGDMAGALTHRLHAFSLAPDHLTATTLSLALINAGRQAEALALADHALGLREGHYEALACRFMALEGLGRFADALAAGRQTLAAAPHAPAAQLDLAVALLGLGQMTAEAWALYEARFHTDPRPAPTASPCWAGEDIAGRTILLYAEQGFGDTLQFVRYAPLVAARGARVILAVPAALLRLLRTVPGVAEIVALGGALPPSEFACPLLSLPGVFGTTLDSIPPALPYADSFAPGRDAGGGLHVGLVWAGYTGFVHNAQRSIAAADFGVLAGIPGVIFHSLQRHDPTTTALPPSLGAIDRMAEVRDFADTAALIAELDLVIAVDTAVAHLAATMGKPVWLLSRFRGCWRWLHDRADSPWYPSVRIIRQQRPDDWGGVLAQVRQALLSRPPT